LIAGASERIIGEDVPRTRRKGGATSTDLTQTSLERPATRADLARRLLARVERLAALLGTVPLATEIQLLKRDLSRGHDLLRPAGETNFLSVVCLVEGALASLTWKLQPDRHA
jgi:hypothetical protein